jgi:SAM-dependent methyltransferase
LKARLISQPASPADAFIALLEDALAQGTLTQLVLAKPRVRQDGVQRLVARPLSPTHVLLVYSHPTQDTTKNLNAQRAVEVVRELLGPVLAHAHLFTHHQGRPHEVQLLTSKKGKQTLLGARPPLQVADHPNLPIVPQPHDRLKQRWVKLSLPFWADLGLADAQGQLVPAMARKWRQINKFLEVLDHALQSAELPADVPLQVVDFGSGKGYLTFAMHAHLCQTRKVAAHVRGIELREDLVQLCNAAAQRHSLAALRFEQGDIRSTAPTAMHIMVALHACDTATDHAIDAGLRAGAAIILCSPCCHKELRPQLLSPHPLRPILKHGIHQAQQAEMLTDGLRALMLEACGYNTRVFEFVSAEHTQKNKMILAIKREAPLNADLAWQQVAEIKSHYGIREQCLETLLQQRQGAWAAEEIEAKRM